MEMFLILFLLALTEKDPLLKDTLQSVLSFYRENKELFAAAELFGKAPAPQEQPSPSENVRTEKIIEEFLKNAHA